MREQYLLPKNELSKAKNFRHHPFGPDRRPQPGPPPPLFSSAVVNSEEEKQRGGRQSNRGLGGERKGWKEQYSILLSFFQFYFKELVVATAATEEDFTLA